MTESNLQDEHGEVLPVEPYIEGVQEPVSVLNPELIASIQPNTQGDLFVETEDETDAFDVTKEWGFSYPDEETQLAIQKALADSGLYRGKQNGKWGTLSVYAIQESVQSVAPEGWFHRIKGGEPDASLCFYIKKLATVNGIYTPIEDHYILSDTDWSAYLMALENKA
jgi:hypothetical protein